MLICHRRLLCIEGGANGNTPVKYLYFNIVLYLEQIYSVTKIS